MLMSWALFLVSAVVIVVAGTKLARYADQIAELNGLGRLWIGVVLVAGATSRPPSFSELPKWFFSSLPGAAVGHAAVSISSSNRCQECGVLPPYRLPTVAKCPPSSHCEHAEWCETSGSLKPLGRSEQGIALAGVELCMTAAISFT